MVATAGANAGYLTLGDYYLARGERARAIDLYKLAAGLKVRGALEKIQNIDPYLYNEMIKKCSVNTEMRKASSLSNRLHQDEK